MSKPTWDFDASQILRVEAWPIERLTPYAKNPRHTTEAAIAAVAESLSRFGWQQPIVATSGGTIVAGHTRHRAAQKLEMAQVPVQVISEEDAAAYRLIDNRTGDSRPGTSTCFPPSSRWCQISRPLISLAFFRRRMLGRRTRTMCRRRRPRARKQRRAETSGSSVNTDSYAGIRPQPGDVPSLVESERRQFTS